MFFFRCQLLEWAFLDLRRLAGSLRAIWRCSFEGFATCRPPAHEDLFCAAPRPCGPKGGVDYADPLIIMTHAAVVFGRVFLINDLLNIFWGWQGGVD